MRDYFINGIFIISLIIYLYEISIRIYVCVVGTLPLSHAHIYVDYVIHTGKCIHFNKHFASFTEIISNLTIQVCKCN